MKHLLEKISRYWQLRFVVVGAGVLLVIYAVVMPVHSTESTSFQIDPGGATSAAGGATIPVLVGAGEPTGLAASPASFAKPWLGENHVAAAELGLAAGDLRQSDFPRDFSESIRRLRRAAEAGDAAAQFLLGHAYQQGFGVPKDMAQTSVWYARAGEIRETAAAQPAGPGVGQAPVQTSVKDLTHALEAYRKAAEAGDIGAQLYLGLSYDRGQDAPRSAFEAAGWYRRAALKGSVAAANNLGALYHDGDGMPKDDAEAKAWFERAAALGSANAQCSLGRMYLDGDGVAQNDAKAAAWLEKAAQSGNVPAQVLLSEMYATGRGVPGNTAAAYMWINLASAWDDRARRSRDHVEAAILPTEVAEGQKMAHDWMMKHPHTQQ